MTALVVFFLANFGFAYIVGFSKISAPLREWLAPYMRENDPTELAPGALNAAQWWLTSLLECPACVGFWFAGLLSPIVALRFFNNDVPEFFVWGCAGAGTNFILARLSRLI